MNSPSVPTVAPIPVLKLDKTKPYGECRGERTPDDPHYNVAYWQGGKIGKDIITLPFDASEDLVPDDGKKEPWKSVDVENKPVTFFPLWTDRMRKYYALKLKKMAEAQEDEEQIEEAESDPSEAVNLPEWLRGHAKYDWALLVAACKKRYGINFQSKAQMVTDLVIDEKVVREEELSDLHKKMLPKVEAAA